MSSNRGRWFVWHSRPGCVFRCAAPAPPQPGRLCHTHFIPLKCYPYALVMERVADGTYQNVLADHTHQVTDRPPPLADAARVTLSK